LRLDRLIWYFFLMIVAYLLLVPVLYFYVYSAFPAETIFRDGLAYITGLVSSVVVAFLSWWVMGLLPTEYQSPVLFFLLRFTLDSVIPFVLLPIIVFLAFKSRFSAKNGIITSLIFGIATVFLPYTMLNRFTTSDSWPALMVPLCLVAFLFSVDLAWRRILAQNPVEVIDLFPSVLFPVAILIITDVLKTLWFFGFTGWVYWPISLMLVAFVFALRLYKYFR